MVRTEHWPVIGMRAPAQQLLACRAVLGLLQLAKDCQRAVRAAVLAAPRSPGPAVAARFRFGGSAVGLHRIKGELRYLGVVVFVGDM
jgi:hypothetical protein